MENKTILDINQIMRYLPHRHPFLLVDKIVELEPDKRVVGIKNVTVNEPFFPGHFPGAPVMPGVLIVEAMAQAGGILSYMTSRERNPGVIYYLAGVDEARFRRPVSPGDRLDFRITVDNIRRGIWFYNCEATVGGARSVSAKITCAPGNTL
jgi:3-hydroxyacyl-[acyl-carrier-protein] dehydratase